jgi:hypothetical protein
MDTPLPDAVVPLPTDPRERLLCLHELARHWLTEASPFGFPDKRGTFQPEAPEGATFAYADLMFAFGLARSGAAEPAATLLQTAREALGQVYPVAACLLEAFAYRIGQALQGQPHQGPLPTQVLDRTARLGLAEQYAVDRLRQSSRIVEPDQKIDPYQRFSASALDGELVQLPKLAGGPELAARVERLIQEGPALDRHATAEETRARVLMAGLSVARLAGEDFALQLLSRFDPIHDALPLSTAGDWDRLRPKAELLQTALLTAVHFRSLDHFKAIVGRCEKLLDSYGGAAAAVRLITYLGGECVRGLQSFGLRTELDRLLTQMVGQVLENQQAPDVDALLHKTFAERPGRRDAPFEGWVDAVRALLPVAVGWYGLGRDGKARAVLDMAHATLVQGRLMASRGRVEQQRLACAYLGAAARAPAAEAQQRFEDLFRHVKVRDSWSTATHYALAQLQVIEAVVLAVASQDMR